MILILLGTQDKPFERLLKEVDKLKKEGTIKDKVIAQAGCTTFDSKEIETFDFKSKEEIEELIDKAKFIITHAGVGTMVECLSKNKKIIVVPRLKKYGEHTNDHQLQITKEFANKNYIIPLYNVKKLKGEIEKVKTFKPAKYTSNKDNFAENIKNIIDNI